MADRIKGITVEIGGDVTGLNKALAGTNNEIKSTQDHLKDVERLLKLDPQNTVLLEQKQRLLSDAVDQNVSKLDALKKSNEGVTANNEKYEEWAAAFSKIQEQTTKAEKKLSELKKEQKEFVKGSDEYKEVQSKIEETEKKISDLGKQAKDTYEQLGKPMSVEQYDALQREIVSTELEIKRLTSETESFQKALDGVEDDPIDILKKSIARANEEIRTTQSELAEVERLLNMDSSDIRVLEQQQRLLSDAITETVSKLDTLKDEEKLVQEQFKRGEVSQRQYDALQREIIATEQDLRKLEDQAREVNDSIEKIDEDPIEDVKKAADKAGDALENAGKDASNFGDFLKAGAIVETAKSIAGAISDLNEETKEYRKIMGTLETSSEAAGYSAGQTAQTYNQLYGVLGDDQTAATATANLQALGLSQAQLMELVKSTVGAWAKYGDSIPIDGLSEAINETVKTGQVTGNFADVLNWGSKEGETFGVRLKENIEFTKLSEQQLRWMTEAQREEYKATKEQYDAIEAYNKKVEDAASAEDFFNIALEECSTEAERANLVMQAMTDQGLTKSGEAWRENNADIVAANESQAEFTEKAAEMAERVAPAMQAVKDGGNDLFQVFLDATEQIDFEGLSETIGTVFDVVSAIITFLIENYEPILAVLAGIAAGLVALQLASLIGTLASVASGATTVAAAFPLIGSAISLLTNPIFIVTAAIVAVVALIAMKGDEIQAILQKLDGWLQSVFATDWTNIFGPVLGSILNGFFANLKNIWDSIYQIFNGVIDFIRGVFTGDWERAWNGVVQIFGGILNGIVAVAKVPLNGIIGLLNGAVGAINYLIGGLNRIGFDLPDWLGGGSFRINIPSIPSIPYLAKGGILSEGSAVVGEAGPELLTVGNGRAVVQPLSGNNGHLDSQVGGSASGGPGIIEIVVPVTLDGRQVGEATYRYIQQRERAYG